MKAQAADIAVTIVADDPADADDKPALKQVHFLERPDAETELNRVTRIFLDAGITCRVVFGFRKFMELALGEASRRVTTSGRRAIWPPSSSWPQGSGASAYESAA